MPEAAWPGAGNLQGKRRFAEFIEGMTSVLDFEVLELREFIACFQTCKCAMPELMSRVE